MTPLQRELGRQLLQAGVSAGGVRVVYRSEYLGYLPYGHYQWVTVAGRDVSLACPDGWSWSDLEALADAGALVRVSRWVNPKDNLEAESHYDLAESTRQPVPAPDPARDAGS